MNADVADSRLEEKYHSEKVGCNSNLVALQAKLPRVFSWNEKRPEFSR
jgi:hypothetical protein